MKVIYILVSSAKKIEFLPYIYKKLKLFNIYFIFTPNTVKIFSNEIKNLPKNRVIIDFNKKKLPKEDLILFYPCTFNSLNKIYLNIADNLPLSLFFSSNAPKIIVPSMNMEYWNNLNKKILPELSKKHTILWPLIENNKITAANIDKVIDNVFLYFNKYQDFKLIEDNKFVKNIGEFEEYNKIYTILKKYIFVNDSSGNISFKINNQIFVSASGYNIFKLNKKEIVPIRYNSKKREIYYPSKCPLPSVETPFLSKLFFKCNSKYIVHFHDPNITYNEKYNSYKSKQYKSYCCDEIPLEIFEIIEKNNFFILKEHGIFIVVDNLKELDYVFKYIYSLNK
ncbi:MAG: flavoprotein [Candidatus ainarchaeum sp.]|nr:flavoprotein [Candidatus ainarchaeum sp.]